MNKYIFLFATLSVGLFLVSSCAEKPQPKEKTVPVAQKVKEPAPKKSTPAEPPTSDFIMLSGDTKLPTKEDLADGADTSIGAGQSGDDENAEPTTTIKPPVSSEGGAAEPEPLLGDE